jgi:predicted kinase
MNDKKIVILTVGAPASGKSTWGKYFCKKMGYKYLSSDKNREILGKDENDQTVSKEAFELLYSDLKLFLENPESEPGIVLDATFMYKRIRAKYIQLAKSFGAKIFASLFLFPKEVLLIRNEERSKNGGRNVPEEIIDKMLNNYQRPELDEFDEVYLTFLRKY